MNRITRNLIDSIGSAQVSETNVLRIDFNNFSIIRTFMTLCRYIDYDKYGEFISEIDHIIKYTRIAIASGYDDDKMNDLKSIFINITRKYVNIIVTNQPGYKITSCICGTAYIDFIEISSTQYQCPECFYILVENETVYTVKANTDDQLNKVKKALDIYCNNVQIPFYGDLKIKLDEYMSDRGYPTFEESSSLPIIDGMRLGTSMNIMWDALDVMGYSAYFPFSMCIACNYWILPSPNIDSIRDDFFKMYVKILSIYDDIPEDVRRHKSRLNMQVILPFILTQLGVNVRISHFKMPNGEKPRAEIKRLLTIICNIAELPYYNIF